MVCRALPLLLVLGCSGGEAPPAVEAGPLDGGWPARLLDDPTLFTGTVAAHREGWIAFHNNDYAAAAAGLDGVGRTRALQEQARFYGDLARMASFAWQATCERWQKRAGLPEGSAMPVLVALAAFDDGDAPRGAHWLEVGGSYADPDVAQVASQLAGGGLEAVAGDSRLARCVQDHLGARRDAAPDRVAACWTEPLVREQAGDHARLLYDPLVYRTLEVATRPAPGTPVEGEGMADLLFGPWWTEEDRDATGGGRTLGALGLAPLDAAADDDPEWARQWVRKLDASLDAWAAGRAREASPEISELLDGLRIVGVYRSHLLLEQARAALAAGHPRQALAFAQLGMDVEHSREIGPLNPPGLFAVIAEANLRTGHTREALNALEVLATAFPIVQGLDETVGDLAVLEGIGRDGDSKEN